MYRRIRHPARTVNDESAWWYVRIRIVRAAIQSTHTIECEQIRLKLTRFIHELMLGKIACRYRLIFKVWYGTHTWVWLCASLDFYRCISCDQISLVNRFVIQCIRRCETFIAMNNIRTSVVWWNYRHTVATHKRSRLVNFAPCSVWLWVVNGHCVHQ